MARYLFASVLVELPGNILAPATVVTFWSDLHGGTLYSDLTTPDGVTPVGSVVTDVNGVTPELRGPNGIETMYADAGAGVRFPFYATDELSYVLDQFRVVAALVTDLQAQILAIGVSGGGGGLPAGTTLDAILDGASRVALSPAQRTTVNNLPATFLQIGTTTTTAKSGNYAPTAAAIGAVQSMSGPIRIWSRTALQGAPTAADGAVDLTDYLFLDAS